MDIQQRPPRILASAAVAVMLGVFFWSARSVLSPLVVGGIVLFFLFGLWENPLARRLSGVIVIVMAVWIFLIAQSVFMPLIFAFVLAYLFNPLVDKLTGLKIPRIAGVVLVLLLALGSVVLIGAILIPSMVSEIQDLLRRSENMPERFMELVETTLPRVLRVLRIDPATLKERVADQMPTSIDQVFSGIQKGVSGAGNFLGQLLNLILVPVMTFYLLKDFSRLESWFMGLIPRQQRGVAVFYLWRFNRILGGYLRAQAIVCVFVGISTGLGLALFGIQFAVLIGVVTGLLNIVPFVGFYTSLVLVILIGLISPDPVTTVLKITGVFLVVQTIESYVVSPKIVGDRVGLHPVAVIFSILIFSRFFGFWGLLIGVPTAAVIKFFIDEWKRRQKRRELLEAARHGT
ncbi:MAG TPA: AI-2E family transporter [bacterium]|nr:AI-2E family transporter [bacterium]